MSTPTDVFKAAQHVIERCGTRGAIERAVALRDVLRALPADLAVIAEAAVWLNRYGTSGAGEAMSNLRAVVSELQQSVPEPGDDAAEPGCSCDAMVGDRHGRGCDLYDGWAE